MKKFLVIFGVALSIMLAPAMAQVGQNDLDLFKKIDQMPGNGKTPALSGTAKNAATKKEPTIITATQEASFDAKLRMAIFVGSVYIQDPQFTLSSDKLTVYFKKSADDKDAKPGDKTKPTATPQPTAAKPGIPPSPGGSGGLDKVLAEGNVIVTSDRPDSNGGQPVHYVGRGAKVEYNTSNGEAILYGWPQIEQGINTIVSTEESTVMHLFKDGKMRINGGTKTVVTDPGPDKNVEVK